MNPKEITGLIWLFFGLYWLVRAFRVKKTVYAESPGARILQFALWIGAFILVYSHRPASALLDQALFSSNDLVIYLGTAFTIIGVAFAIWARQHLGMYWSATVTLKEDHRLVRSGPYGISRHPIYTGLLLAYFGTALAIAEVRGLIGIILVLIAVAKKIRDEEKLLQSHFPREYSDYCREVKMLIPGLW